MDKKRAYNRYIPTQEVFFNQAQAARMYHVSVMTIWRYANEYGLLNKYVRPVGKKGARVTVHYKKSELDSVFIPKSSMEAAQLCR